MTFTSTLLDLPARLAPLVGNEPIETVSNGVSARIVAQQISDLAKQNIQPELDQTQETLTEVIAQVNEFPSDPANSVVSFTIPAKNFDVVQGTPVYAKIESRLFGWSFDDTTAGYISCPLTLPAGWHSMNIYVQWVNLAANNGSVVWGGEIQQWGVGDAMNISPAGFSLAAVADPRPFVLVESKAGAAGTSVPLVAGKNTTLRIARQGASGSDTLPNSVAILAIRLEKAS